MQVIPLDMNVPSNHDVGVNAKELEPRIPDDMLWGMMTDPLTVSGLLNVIVAAGGSASDDINVLHAHSESHGEYES
jgi:hypothetical protein